jgi:hypothetical protein
VAATKADIRYPPATAAGHTRLDFGVTNVKQGSRGKMPFDYAQDKPG